MSQQRSNTMQSNRFQVLSENPVSTRSFGILDKKSQSQSQSCDTGQPKINQPSATRSFGILEKQTNASQVQSQTTAPLVINQPVTARQISTRNFGILDKQVQSHTDIKQLPVIHKTQQANEMTTRNFGILDKQVQPTTPITSSNPIPSNSRSFNSLETQLKKSDEAKANYELLKQYTKKKKVYKIDEEFLVEASIAEFTENINDMELFPSFSGK